MSRSPIGTLALLIAVVSCASPYRQRPPQTDIPETEVRPPPAEADRVEPDVERPTEEAGDPAPAPDRRTIVGTISSDGVLRADTLAGVHPDTSRVVRETVVSGALRPRASTLVTGYRVQVFASRDREIATREAQRLRGRVGEPVYVEWDDPWYKVRVGDFTERGVAESLRARLVAEGYAEAWIAATSIRTQP